MLRDIEKRIAGSPSNKRAGYLRRVTDLFLRDADALTEQQIEVFDVVIARLATAIETQARAELANRLADAANAPRGVVRSLAHDEIQVARPVLTRSERLSDDDLVAVALAKGREHMLAIAERRTLTEPVTDVLVTRGDRHVVHSVAGNPGARFSRGGMAALLDRSRLDEALRERLGQRKDITEEHLRQLVDIAKEAARRRMSEGLPGVPNRSLNDAVEIGASAVEAAVVPGRPDYAAALERVNALADAGALDETALAGFGEAGHFAEAVCALARLADLSLATAEKLFKSTDSEMLLIAARAQGWTWETLRALLPLRIEGNDKRATARNGAADGERTRETFERLKLATAQRVLQFLKARDASQKRTAETAAARQIRENER